MATQEEIYKLQLIVKGQAEQKQLEQEIAKTEKTLKVFGDQLQQGAINLNQYKAATASSAAQLVDLKRDLESVSKEIKSLGGGAKVSGRGILELGHAFQDLAQGGIAGVLNNIPGLLTSFGGSAGLAGVITLTAVAGKLLYDNFGKLTDLFGLGATKTEAQEMEELAKQTSRTADEEERLAKWKEYNKNLDEQKAKPEAQTKTQKAVNKAVAEGPLEEINKGLDKHFGNRIRAIADIQDPATVKELAEARAAAERERKTPNKGLNEGRRQLDQERIRLAEERVGNAKTNENAPGGGKELSAAREALLAARKVAAKSNPEERLKLAQEADDANLAKARDRFRVDLGTKPDTARVVGEAARKNPKDFGKDGAKFGQGLIDAVEGVDPGERDKASRDFRKNIKDFGKKVAEAYAKKAKELDEAAKKKIKDQAEKFEKEVDSYTAKGFASFSGPTSKLNAAQKEAAKRYEEQVAKSVSAAGGDNPNLLAANGKKLTDADQKKVDAAKKKEDAAKAKKEKDAATKAKKQSKVAMDHIKDSVDQNPFGDSQLEQEILSQRLGGKSDLQSTNALTARLAAHYRSQDGSLSHEDAIKLADEQARGASRRVNDQLLQPAEKKASQIFDPSEFANAIQSGFKDDIPKNQLQVLEKIYDELKKNPGAMQQLGLTFQ